MKLVSLQFKTTTNYKNNLNHLVSLIELVENDSLILCPELCLTNFDYDNFTDASNFSIQAINRLQNLSTNKTICITMIIKNKTNFYNTLFVFNKKNIVHTQNKTKLFALGDEHRYFAAGDKKDIKIFEIDGIKIACLICFELRFIELWQEVKGADIILIPAMWGKARTQNYISLTNTLAIVNQCYLIASNSSNTDMAGCSAIIDPFGDHIKNNQNEINSMVFDKTKIKSMRKYINIGLNID
jgi:predicted amidohydrolase